MNLTIRAPFDKPVLSNAFALRPLDGLRIQGERVFPKVLSEVEGRAQVASTRNRGERFFPIMVSLSKHTVAVRRNLYFLRQFSYGKERDED